MRLSEHWHYVSQGAIATETSEGLNFPQRFQGFHRSSDELIAINIRESGQGIT